MHPPTPPTQVTPQPQKHLQKTSIMENHPQTPRLHSPTTTTATAATAAKESHIAKSTISSTPP